MDDGTSVLKPNKPAGRSLLYTLPMLLITFMFMTGGRPDFSDSAQILALMITFAGVNVLFFLMHFTGKTDRYRAVLFIAFALSLFYIDQQHAGNQKLNVI